MWRSLVTDKSNSTVAIEYKAKGNGVQSEEEKKWKQQVRHPAMFSSCLISDSVLGAFFSLKALGL